jgi:large subunit ribosomal protein L31
MREAIHPDYKDIKATCSCGNAIEIKSTLAEDIQLDVCSECHPFYTGKQKLVDTGGRVDKFRKRFGNKTKAAPVAEAPAEEVVAEEAPAEEAAAEEAPAEEVVAEEAPEEEAAAEEAPAEEVVAEEAPEEEK